MVETQIGTTVVETPKRVYNPVNDEYKDLTNLSEDGYLRKFLALRASSGGTDVVDFSSTPIASFDKDKWELKERDGSYIMVKKNAESDYGELVLG